MSEETRQCVAFTSRGARCTHTRDLSTDQRCRWHDPARVELIRDMRRRGQAAGVASRAEKARVRLAQASETAGPRPAIGDSLASVTEWLRWLAEAGVRGEVQRAEIAGLASVARLLVQALTQRDLEAQLRTLQRQYTALKRQLERAR